MAQRRLRARQRALLTVVGLSLRLLLRLRLSLPLRLRDSSLMRQPRFRPSLIDAGERFGERFGEQNLFDEIHLGSR